jgi:F-box/leucine-rich repeat protein 2/20
MSVQNVGDMGLVALGKGCPLLKEVVLSHCRRITDVGLSLLVNKCKKLESCHMVYCPGVTAVGVATVITSCNALKKVLVEKWKVTPRTRRRASAILMEFCMDL